MATSRLYNPPHRTLEALEKMIGGNNSKKDLADALGYNKNSNAIYNVVHDPDILGLIENESKKYTPTKEARKAVQLQDYSVLEDAFRELAGVEDILQRLEKEEKLAFETIGRTIAFEIESDATDPEAFRSYGRIYAKWIDFLDLGDLGSESIYLDKEHADQIDTDKPLENPHGSEYPRVNPSKVLEVIRIIDSVDTREELINEHGYSDADVGKILSTCYALQLLEKKRSGELELTEIGKELQSNTNSESNRQKILRDQLLDIPFVQAYCNRVPDTEFENQEIIKEISTDYNRGWNDTTIKTRSKRIYRWLIYTGLAQEVRRGYLQPEKPLKRRKIPNP